MTTAHRTHATTKHLLRAALGLAWFLSLLLAGCEALQAAGPSRAANEGTPGAALGTVQSTPVPTAIVQRQKTLRATPPASPTSALDAWQATSTPVPATPLAPDFRLPDVEGTMWTLSQFQGQPVMLFFWATW
jgi:hypothetical protein